ncbi:MAG: hypothetical protein WCJ21_09435 [Planctomycetota bacterium]
MPELPASLIHPSAAVPDALRDLIAEAAIAAASHAGAAIAHHQAQEDLDALLREALDRGAPKWLTQRVDELAQHHLDAGDHHGHAAEVRLDVVHWLTGTPSQSRAAVPVSLLQAWPALTLVPDHPVP